MRLYPPPVPPSVAATLKRSGIIAYFFGANPFFVSHSKTNSPAGPSLPVGLSMFPSASARSTTSFGSMRFRTSSTVTDDEGVTDDGGDDAGTDDPRPGRRPSLTGGGPPALGRVRR